MRPGDRVEHHTIGVPATVVIVVGEQVLVRFDRAYKPWEVYKPGQLERHGARATRAELAPTSGG